MFLGKGGMGATRNNGPCRAIILCIFCYPGVANLGLPWLQIREFQDPSFFQHLPASETVLRLGKSSLQQKISKWTQRRTLAWE